MITRVKLKNWKSHEETDVVFGDGTNVLIGPMGSGKSSILEAVAYALFGTLPGVKSKTIKLEDLIRSRPVPMNQAEVEVWFVGPDGTEYVVRRVISRGSGTVSSELRKATGEPVETGGTSRVNENVVRILGMNYDLFERAVYSEQDRLDHFLSLPKGKRMENIDELLDIDRLEKARGSIVSLVKSVRKKAAETLDEARRRMEDRDVRDLESLSSGLAEFEAEILESRKTLEEAEREMGSLRARLEELDRTERELLEVERTMRELQGKVGSLSSQLDELERRVGPDSRVPVEDLERIVKQVEDEYAGKKGELERLNSELTSLSSRLSGLESERSLTFRRLEEIRWEIGKKMEKLDELKKRTVKSVRSEIDSLVMKLGNAQRLAADSRATADNIRKSLEELKGSGSVCPVCDSPLGEDKKGKLIQKKTELLGRIGEDIQRAESEVARISQEIEMKNSELQRLLLAEKETANLPEMENEASSLERRLEAITSGSSELTGKIEGLRSRLMALKNESCESEKKLSEARQRLVLRKEQDRIETEHKVRLCELEGLRGKLDDLRKKYDEKSAAETRKKWEDLYGFVSSKKAELAGKEKLVDERRRIVESARRTLHEARVLESRARHLEEAGRMLVLIQNALLRTQSSMRRMFVDGVNEVMNDLWESIYPYGDFIGIKLSVTGEERTGDYVLMLMNMNGDWVPVEGLVSGGERTDACLALRIAFSIVLAPNLRWIVFDEPTHNLDSDGIAELAKVLRERMPEVVRQVLLITHEERLESAVSGYLYRFFRNKDAEEPTRVEQVTAPEIQV